MESLVWRVSAAKKAAKAKADPQEKEVAREIAVKREIKEFQ
jgi:hypothetical protein